jgi:predicted permease
VRALRAWLVRVVVQLGGARRRRDEFDEELDSLVALHTDDNIRAGMSPADARRAALMAPGSRAALRDDYRDRAGVPAAAVLADALREAWRGLVRHPALSAAVIAMLALGAGSTTALAGLVDALLFRPPDHVADPDRLVEVNGAPNYVTYREVARRSRTLDVAAVSRRSLIFGRDDAARPVAVRCVTAGYFPLLGATPVAGRAFLPEEDVRNGEPVAMLSYGLWQRDFGGRPDVVGATATIASRSHRIVGIAPPDFRGLESARVDAWLLIAVAPDLCSFVGRDLLDNKTGAWLTTLGRLRPGVSVADAEAELRSFSLHEIRSPGRKPLARELDPAESRSANTRDELLALYLAAGAGLILLIACANVAGLLSVRALERRREIAVRVQLGASRARVFTQLFAENLMLTAVCGVAAWGIASALTTALLAFFPSLARDAWFDSRAFAALAAFTLGAGVVAGLVPAIQAARAPAGALWRVGQDLGHRRGRWRGALIVAQMALAVVLVASAGLFTRSLIRATSDLGYDLDRIAVAPLDLEQAGIAQPAEARRLFDDILARAGALPGVEAASLTTTSPLGSGLMTVMAMSPDAPAGSLTQTLHVVSPEYFRTLGTRIVEGRPFTEEDRRGAPPVMIVDANLARELWPGEAVVGRCKSLSPIGPCATVVGISEPRRLGSLTEPESEIFSLLAQEPDHVPQALFVRSAGDVRDIVPAVAAAIRSAVPSLAYADVRPLADLADAKSRSWRLGATLFGLFGGIAVVLAAAGLYASLAFAVRQRTAEIGVRIALGADSSSVARLVLWQGGRLVAAGWLIGAAAALAVASWIRSLLFGVQPDDPIAFVVASLVVVAAGVAGCALPARRAARVDPVVALRSE